MPIGTMKTIGVIGGMSWESTAEYYRLMNTYVRDELGSLHSARILMYSCDFAEIERMQQAGDWEQMAGVLGRWALNLEQAGAELMVIATNTMHRVAPGVQSSISVPLIHIADATAEAAREIGLTRLGLLGTRFTMEQDFYRQKLACDHGIEVLVPSCAGRSLVHDVIYDELCQGIVRSGSREAIGQVIDGLVERGAEGIILGCTELPLIIRDEDVDVVRLDTTAIHARAAVRAALG